MRPISIYLFPAAVTGALILFFAWDFGPGSCLADLAVKSKCADIEKRYDEILSNAGGACTGNADCGCYGPVSVKSGCGGVTDKKSADRLRELGREFRHTGCDFHIRCAAWFCNPVCSYGRCNNGPRKR